MTRPTSRPRSTSACARAAWIFAAGALLGSHHESIASPSTAAANEPVSETYADFGFDETDTGLAHLWNDATLSNGAVRLNSGANSQGAWVLGNQLRIGSGALRVEFRFRATPSADGMRLRIAPLHTPGYPEDTCCDHQIDVHFDHHLNSDQPSEEEIDGNHFELSHNNQHVTSVTSPFGLEDDVWRRAVLELDGDVLTFSTVDEFDVETTIFDQVQLTGFEPFDGQIMVRGWNGAGGSGCEHWIDDVLVTGSPGLLVPDCNGNGVGDATEIALGFDSDLDANGVPDACLPVTLTADVLELSLAAGGTQHLALSAGPQPAFNLYFVVGTASGTAPGVATFAGTLPINPDPFTDFALAHLNTLPYGSNFGVLPPSGDGQITFTVPNGTDPALAGLTLHHAAVVLDMTGPFGPVPSLVSNPVPLALVP